MDALEVFQIYLPIKLHFTSAKFDVFETRRIKNTTLEYYLQRQDKGRFYSLSKGFKSPKDCCQYFVSNFAYGYSNSLYDVDDGIKNLKIWRKRKESITEIFRNDFGLIRDQNMTSDEILQEFVLGNIALESVSIMNDYFNFTSKWVDNLLWDKDILRVKKSKGFVKYNPERIENIMKRYT